PGGGPHVNVFSGPDLSVIDSFFAFDANFGGGVNVAAGDVDGDSRPDIIVGAGAGGGPHVKAFSGTDLSLRASFFAYGANFAGGVRVAVADVNGDGFGDVITAPGTGLGPTVEAFDVVPLSQVKTFAAFDPAFLGGVYVGAGA